MSEKYILDACCGSCLFPFGGIAKYTLIGRELPGHFVEVKMVVYRKSNKKVLEKDHE